MCKLCAPIEQRYGNHQSPTRANGAHVHPRPAKSG
jgi:hypothetical protein